MSLNGARLASQPKNGQTKAVFHFVSFGHIIASFMANREESQAISQEILAFKEESRIHIGKSGRAVARRKPTALWSHFLSHEWSSAVLYLFLDVVSWLAIYRVAGWFRYDAFYATPFQFFIINLIQLGVIVTALYFVGGYDHAELNQIDDEELKRRGVKRVV